MLAAQESRLSRSHRIALGPRRAHRGHRVAHERVARWPTAVRREKMRRVWVCVHTWPYDRAAVHNYHVELRLAHPARQVGIYGRGTPAVAPAGRSAPGPWNSIQKHNVRFSVVRAGAHFFQHHQQLLQVFKHAVHICKPDSVVRHVQRQQQHILRRPWPSCVLSEDCHAQQRQNGRNCPALVVANLGPANPACPSPATCS
eukprot:scaffold45581_cov73-Phaeocystis_antarctica.AAC.4